MLNIVIIGKEEELKELTNNSVTEFIADVDLVLLHEVNLLTPEDNIHVQEVANIYVQEVLNEQTVKH